ncbi:F-actin-monooxygenase Mical isoform X3 [Teleopsis dalmanni]|uniref:F-actin-monooxygenase Mical isoform X3 n=1 Tax=Teleopsis dalmanni TaxID=139649 RepID=UPI0018CF9306|nr:F-actin-monooxygenase Mical isoform X3 [Teleopsis dalmanni]
MYIVLMSRQRQQQKLQQQQLLVQQQQMADNEAAAAAAEMFDLFCMATTMRQILGLHRNMCDVINIRPSVINEFYPKLKQKIRSWKAQALWKKFDARAAHRVYAKGNACSGTRVLVIGAGPCGLRTAIEAQLLGAKVVVVEKRDRISRNNVLHLWPFVITDLRNLGAKKFYGKFCAGSIDHISIRQLQCILLKVALLLGVEIHEGVSFERTIEPSGDGCGWRAVVTPADHAVSHYEFDVLIGADGKRNTLEGFKRKEFRGKLAIAITANFINKKTEAEAKAEEISGVAFIFNQSFFKELYEKTYIDLENIVYYKDETHYFVMTAKKHSLIDKGVIIQDFADPAELLAINNVNSEKLLDYAREAAEFSTKYQMTNLEFAVNHYGKPDVAMFDFTSMFAAETSCKVIVRKGFRLLQCLVGDSLLEPFWPTGSGCARGFLSSMDAAYAIKLWSNSHNSTLGVLAQRESIYRLLNQTTPENLQRDTGSYTVDPATRYPNLNRTSVNVWQVKHLIDTDDPSILEQTFMDTNALQPTQVDSPVRRKRRSGDTLPFGTVLLCWISAQLHKHDFVNSLKQVSDVFTNGKVLCALINRYRPDLIDFNAVKDLSPVECNEIAFQILDRELHIPRIMSGEESVQLNATQSKVWLNYLEQIYDVFRGEIPHVKHPKMDFPELREKYRVHHGRAEPDFSNLLQISSKQKTKLIDAQNVGQKRSILDEERLKRLRKHELNADGENVELAAAGSVQQAHTDTPRRAKKRRSAEKATNIEDRQKRLQEIEQNRQDRLSKRRQQRYQQTQNFYKSLHMLQANTLLRESDENSPFEDYSIFLYRQQAPEFNDRVKELERKLLYPDRDRGDIPSALPRSNADEQFSDRIKSMEQRITSRNTYGTDKKPKDLMRAIGKIDSNDWNVREIEKKIEQSKKTEIHGPKGREKVPKWSKEQFKARQNKMSKPMRMDSNEEKFKEIDQTLKNLDKQLKEGSILEVGERGRNKVASIAGQFVKKDDISDEKNPPTVVQKSSSKVALAFKKQAAAEKCHFCKQIVYLMEKVTAEGLILHRSCLKCHHCHTNLRLNAYAFDRDDPNGRFYCTQHFRLPAKAIRPMVRKPGQRKPTQQQQAAAAAATTVIEVASNANLDRKPVDKLRSHTDNVAQIDLLDRGQTPERIEFENTDAMSDGEPSEEHIIDEHEWSGRNFLPESNNDSESDLSSSDESDTESDSDMFEEANDSPLGAQTLQLATDWIGKQNYTDSDDVEFDYSSDGLPDNDDTEGEEFKKARELRREEVRLLPLPANLPTDTETEVQTESDTTSPNEAELNSATEISTDSEFENDEVIREAPKILIDDTHIKKPTKVKIKSAVITTSTSNKHNIREGSYLAKYQTQHQPPQPQFKPLVQVDPTLLNSNRAPLQNPRPGDYLLNKTASTEGIASKKSLELKKRYLLGEAVSGNKIQKSGSTSVLDSKIRSFQSNISECQKLLNPSSDVSPSMKTFLDRTKLGENNKNEILRSATSNILNELRVAITIQKASSTTSTDNEKENVYVNSKNELNKGMEYSESINSTLLESISKKTPTTPTVNTQTIIETIDLVTPEKEIKAIIDLTAIESPKKINKELADIKSVSQNGNIIPVLTATDTNKIIDLTVSSPEKCDNIIIADAKPDISKDVKEHIPDLLGHIEHEVNADKQFKRISNAIAEDQQNLLNNSDDEEKRDSPEKQEEHYENDTLQIEVPTIPWHTRKNLLSSTTASSCTSNSSSLEDIQHYILESTTSPDTQTGSHQVPRVEIHDVTGTLMQTDNLMLADNKYEDDSLNCKYTNNSESIIVPEIPAVKTTVVEDDAELDVEPVTATPEPAECTIIEAKEQAPPLPEQGPPLPEKGPPKIKPANLKFDTKNENKVESLKNLPLVVEQFAEHTKVIKPLTLNLSKSQKTPTTPTANLCTPTSPLIDNDKTPTADLLSKGSDSETEPTGTGHALTETELSDWTADDCISENFIDMEFVLNSNKGTIKRNKKGKRKSNTTKLPTTSEVMFEVAKTAPVAEFEGILKSIDIDDIEFMDTGSESSCAEAYSATNTALLRNRGYIEFIETTPQQTPSHKLNSYSQQLSSDKYGAITTKRDEKLGIDYIEQGAYIMQTEDNSQDMLKTPVNEHPSQQIATILNDKALTQSVSIMTQSLTDSSTLNDLDDDSLCIVTPNSQAQLSSVTAKTTTEESDALTVVTSPIDSSSPKMHEPTAAQRIAGKSPETGGGSTPSSSEKQPKTSQSTCTPSSTSNTMSSKPTPSRQSSQENSALVHSNGSAAGVKNAQSKLSDELSYEYVRALQQKITQISTARDSLESRKQRRKSSKGEAPVLAISKNSQQTVIEPTPPNRLQQNLDDSQTTTMTTPAIGTTHVNRVPEIPTLTRKLEEITKERTKQKDLIHDLVMDKLQSKKQLNAEKRLHRSRQRNMLTSGYGSGSSLSPTPKIEAAKSTDDNNCTNKAHYHVSTAASNADNRTNSQRILTATSTAFKENTPIQTSATYVSAYNTGGIMTTNRSNAYKQRPISEHIHGEKLDALERYKLNKTPSFTYSSSNNKHNTTELPTAEDIKYPIPIAPVRQNRGRNAAVTTPTVENPLTTSTENLRSEARARARLKSNTELGLSPEEKMQLLRKRLQVEHLNVKQNSVTAVTDSVSNSTDSKTGNQMHTKPKANVEHDLSARDRKMSTSKSVNDLVFIANHQQNARTEDHLTATVANSADFTSDPNILLSSTSAQANTKTKSSRRPKDPERRKSLIQSLSSFFHKSSSSSSSHNNKDKKEQNNTTASATNSAPAERPNTSGSSTTASGSTDGMFSRFRISPKSKEKSRDKDGFIRNTVPTTTSLSTRTTPTKTIATKLPHERSNSQECIHHKATTYTRNNHSHQNSNSNNNINNKHNKKLSPSATFSSSSPQLYFANNKLNCASSIHQNAEDQIPPPIPPLPLHYQRSDDESYATETREHKKQRAISKAVRQAELKRLRIAQEIQREQEEIEVQLKELEARGVLIEKALRGEEQQNLENLEASNNIGNSDEKLLKELLEIWRNVTQLKRRDEELGIRQQELQLEHRHAQLKEELNSRLSNCSEYYKLQI